MDLEDFNKKLSIKKEKLIVTITDNVSLKKINYSISNDKTLWRAKTLFTKEPITIKWIRGFKKGSTFFDVGANVGMYTIFAAAINDINVYSFEPEANNFQILMENIVINNLTKKITSFPIGVSDSSLFTTLHMGKFDKGGSHNTVGDSLDHNLNKKETFYKQGIFTTSLDELISLWGMPIPNYLKIDVDGIESKIINKSQNLLSNKKLYSVLVEINPNRKEDEEMISIFKNFGFIYDEEQVNEAVRKDGPHKGYAEYLFYRKEN
ncbi:MAG: hypothetical protein CFH18_00414 [Alphaproteobacteria bacterium MarineAlpha5_Bin8]|nr:MAG: hypothetical protein CFH17_01133 [Alphaproteobacteria bacterium MarineAlpha5_Bin7]PPR47373.1 MAG: hypothetical protein CFH18_00414 [Alphaproteobacteria bacterium MarineAlpha5_Bin8]PPR54773.1 MAG: hypothetical protein CFH16_00222 [Alphaproteobacteria bacterium MarineAlpha5_Bin6]|tara:strand:+ start:313 stop:1104 length:792 start_codon:yes stop_codon:yes gene_type:complete